jgi:hypothetical protein
MPEFNPYTRRPLNEKVLLRFGIVMLNGVALMFSVVLAAWCFFVYAMSGSPLAGPNLASCFYRSSCCQWLSWPATPEPGGSTCVPSLGPLWA